MAKFLSGYMLFCGTPAVWLRLPLQDKHNNSDGHTITMEDSFLSSHMSSTYSDCLLYTDVPVSVNTLFSLSFLYIYLGKQTTCTTVWEVFGCCDEERDVIPACHALSQLTAHSNSDDSKIPILFIYVRLAYFRPVDFTFTFHSMGSIPAFRLLMSMKIRVALDLTLPQSAMIL